MKKTGNLRKRKTFIYKGLGIPVKLVNAPIKKAAGEWCIDIDMNRLMLLVLQEMIHKPVSFTGNELRYIRSYLEMTLDQFGKMFGVSHVAVLKWEKDQNRISPALELCIRLYVLNHLQAKDNEFRALYSDISLAELSKKRKAKICPIIVDASNEELKIAL